MLQCTEAWVSTARSNAAAMRLYDARGGKASSPDPVMFEFRIHSGLH
jgi:hypothetical protein